jgi:hypothetical protein
MVAAQSPILSPDEVEIDPHAGLAIIDVDEVLALFIAGFDRFLRPHGYEFRLLSFGLFTNVFALGADAPAAKDESRALFDRFFAQGCGDIDPAPGAVEGLRALSQTASVVILTNAPEAARRLRGDWLRRHGMDYPMILNEGPKGPAVARLAARTTGAVLFVDDLIPQLDSVAEVAPAVHRVQMVADLGLRALAPSSPRHRRIDDWDALVALARTEVF